MATQFHPPHNILKGKWKHNILKGKWKIILGEEDFSKWRQDKKHMYHFL
jgi:hypothetical protein